jgi:hypothetical protein
MPIPDAQRRQLDDALRSHEDRMASLNESIRTMQGEISVHETLVGLGRNAAVRAVFDELYDHPEIATEFARNPEEFLRQKRIVLPPGTQVRVTARGRDSTRVEVRFRQPPFDYRVVWDRGEGFSLVN